MFTELVMQAGDTGLVVSPRDGHGAQVEVHIKQVTERGICSERL